MRTLPLVPAFKTRLLEHQQRIEENKRLCGRSYSKQYLDYICIDSMGNLIKPGYVTSAFPVLLKKHGLRKIRYHDLRHSYVKPRLKIFFKIKRALSKAAPTKSPFDSSNYMDNAKFGSLNGSAWFKNIWQFNT